MYLRSERNNMTIFSKKKIEIDKEKQIYIHFKAEMLKVLKYNNTEIAYFSLEIYFINRYK